MNKPHLEFRKWFQILAVTLSLAIVLPSMWALRVALPADAALAHIGLLVITAGAIPGLERLFTLLLPIALLKFWPKLETPSRNL